MDPTFKHRLVWGWLRVILGHLQMWTAIIGLAFFCVEGSTTITWVFVGSAGVCLIISRVLYGGRSDPGPRK